MSCAQMILLVYQKESFIHLSVFIWCKELNVFSSLIFNIWLDERNLISKRLRKWIRLRYFQTYGFSLSNLIQFLYIV